MSLERNSLLKRYFLNCLIDVEKTILYFGLFFKLIFYELFLISLLFLGKLLGDAGVHV